MSEAYPGCKGEIKNLRIRISVVLCVCISLTLCYALFLNINDLHYKEQSSEEIRLQYLMSRYTDCDFCIPPHIPRCRSTLVRDMRIKYA